MTIGPLTPPGTPDVWFHGDQAAGPGMLDFAVNVRAAAPPDWLAQRLSARIGDLGRYPSRHDEQRATEAVAARHGRSADHVALLAGGAEGFALLTNLDPRLAALIAPSFTEPDVVLSAAGIPYCHVVLADPFGLAGIAVPDDADLVIVGNPTNPTSVLHSRESILALRRPGRIVVVDEAFADAVPGEPESLAGVAFDDVVVLRSLTKTWGLAGPEGGLRPGLAGCVVAVDGPPGALAGRHPADGGRHRVLRARRGGPGGGAGATACCRANRDGRRAALAGARRHRRCGAVRPVPGSGAGSHTKPVGRQGNRRSPM